ncbi:hypothetical protein [Nocardia sp. MW-W600-9]
MSLTIRPASGLTREFFGCLIAYDDPARRKRRRGLLFEVEHLQSYVRLRIKGPHGNEIVALPADTDITIEY